MFHTEIGQFDGNGWEAFVQKCLVLKHESEGYQKMPARFRGDLGIEGLTVKSGKVFQCYCPDEQLDPKSLYENQRDKMTTDLSKIEANEKKLSQFLNGQRIKEWILVTPRYDNKELIRHAREKTKEYRSKKLEILDDEFEVLVHDLDNYTAETPVALKQLQKAIQLVAKEAITDKDITKWKGDKGALVDNAMRKFGFIVPESDAKNNKVDTLTDRAVERFLTGNQIIYNWKERFPERYERFEEIISDFEEEVEDRCDLNQGDNHGLLKQISEDLGARLVKEFEDLDSVSIDKLRKLILSRWILECPIDFE